MIEAADIFRKVRYKLKDLSAVKYSDYDILQSLNEVLEYANQSYALKNSDFLEKHKSFSCSDNDTDLYLNGAALPYDLISLVNVIRSKDNYVMHPVGAASEPEHGEYKVIGSTIYTKETAIDVLYRAKIEELEDIKDDIMLPEIFKPFLVNMTVMVLAGQSESLADAVDSALQNLIPARRYGGARVKMPFIC